MNDLLKIVEKHHIAETLKKIADTSGLHCVTWDKDRGLWTDFHFAIDSTNSLVLIGKDSMDETIPAITLSMESINSIELDLNYGDLTINYHPKAFEGEFNSSKQKFRDLYVATLSSSQEIHLSIKRAYRFENIPAVINYKNGMTPAPSDF